MSLSINTLTNGLTINDVYINEGTNAILTVSLINSVNGGFSVDYETQENTASSGFDYLSNNGTLFFDGFAGETQTITIPTIDDAVEESIESFFVNLTNATNGITIVDSQGIVTLNENDLVCNSDYNEENGTVIIEAENMTLPNGWVVESNTSGYTGSGYINWTGTESFNNPGNGIITSTIKINTPGSYLVQWRNKIGEGTSNTDNNDTWIRFNDASEFYAVNNGAIVYPKGSGQTPLVNGSGSNNWFKAYSNSLSWNWQTRTNDNVPYQVYVRFDTPGVYTMEISARSKNHFIDRIVLTTNTSGQQNLELSETLCNSNNINSTSAKDSSSSTLSQVKIENSGNDNLSVSIYPNSASTEVTISSETTNPNNYISYINLYDIHGRLIKSGNASEFGTAETQYQLPLIGIEDGVYFLRILFSNGQVKLKKLVVKN